MLVSKHLGEGADHLIGHFVDQARQVVVAAQNEARAAGNAQITSAHLVLGLLAVPDSLAVQAVAAQKVSHEGVRHAAAAMVVARSTELPALIPFDAGARKG